jgi:alkanesulfonate monooxygenase SsuD/methylene tetrahydromethanopterin reductase-like flavin-dependent oxidoreductase (luciferase family)
MEFGLALDLGTERAILDRVLDEYVPLLDLAERQGFTSVWAGETYPTGPGYFHLPSPLLALAALAPRTRLGLGTGVTLLPMWPPLRLAYDAAVLDQLCGGRLVLGLGLGAPPTWARFGVPREGLADRIDETLALLRALWSGANGYHGEVLSVEGGIAPRPIQPGGPPLWVGGLVARSARRAARYGDGWYASSNYRFVEIERQAARYRAALEAEGKDPATAIVSVNRLCFLASTPEQARRQGGEYVERVLRRYAAGAGLRGPNDEVLRPDQPLLEIVADQHCLVGSPETVAARLEHYARAGVTHVQLRVAPGDMPADLVAQSITLAGERLIPRLADAPG